MEIEKKPMFAKKNVIIFSFIIIGVVCLAFFLLPFLITQTTGRWAFDQSTGVIGDTIGGIIGPVVGFIGVILTFLAFYMQYHANKIQLDIIDDQKKSAKNNDRQIKVQQIENGFFELLHFHRDNVTEMDYRDSIGRGVIVKILDEFHEILEIVRKKDFVKNNNLSPQDTANISYLILFFGVSDTVRLTLENTFSRHYGNLSIEIMAMVKKDLSMKNKLIKKSDKINKGYHFNGHQSRLAHYFRHLINTVSFIHEDIILTKSEKEKYITLLRSQLSTHEQILLFFNSISYLGLRWELDPKVKPENHLITHYNLIRNVPFGFLYNYDPKEYYPKVRYENDDK